MFENVQQASSEDSAHSVGALSTDFWPFLFGIVALHREQQRGKFDDVRVGKKLIDFSF